MDVKLRWYCLVHEVKAMQMFKRFYGITMTYAGRTVTAGPFSSAVPHSSDLIAQQSFHRDIDIAILSVCPSVCLPVTFRYQMKTA